MSDATATITVKIPFLGWTGRADLEVQIPGDTDPRWHLRAALEIANRDGARLDGARLNRARLVGARLNRASLVGASLIGASLDGARLIGASLDGASLVGARLNRASLNGARLNRASLVGASLIGASLVGASLVGASLVGASLDGASLDGASLDGARLDGASINRARLDGARLDGARLDGASLVGASLEYIRNDLWDVLLRAQPEVPALLDTLRAGKIDGSTYEGECACLAGTIAHARHVPYSQLGFADASRPIERWFLSIKIGDTPENSQIAKITEGWIVEFQSLIGQAA